MKETVGVLGLGAMGLGIAQVFLAAGHRVVATDAHGPARDSAALRLRDGLMRRVAAGKMPLTEAEAMLGRLDLVPDVAGLTGAALVIEAIVEDMAAKRAALAAVAEASPGAVLATNTSALSVARMAEGLGVPLVGLHFFNPAPVMRLVELVSFPGADAAALALARRLTEGAGKVVIGCADRPGFIVNRCARPYYGEALALLEEGRSAAAIDAAMVAAGYRLGPFALIDLIGADVHLAATEGIWQATGRHPRYHVFDALRQQVALGRLGRKTGAGFVDGSAEAPADAAAIALRIESALVNEAASLLAEGDVTEEDIDTALRLGLNFPRGAFAAGRVWGMHAVRGELHRLAAICPPHLEGRYDAAPGLTAG